MLPVYQSSEGAEHILSQAVVGDTELEFTGNLRQICGNLGCLGESTKLDLNE